MPGLLDKSKPGSSYCQDWFIYRRIVGADDLDHPEAVGLVIDLTKNYSGVGGQIWVRPWFTSALPPADITLTLVASNFGSLRTIKPFVTVATAVVANDTEWRFTGLLAVPHRILVTTLPDAACQLHVTHLSLPLV